MKAWIIAALVAASAGTATAQSGGPIAGAAVITPPRPTLPINPGQAAVIAEIEEIDAGPAADATSHTYRLTSRPGEGRRNSSTVRPTDPAAK